MKNKQILEERLRSWIQTEVKKAEEAGKHMFLGHPDEWYELGPTWADINGHISNSYLKSESMGCVCLSCYEPLFFCPPISEDELKEILHEKE